MSTLEAPIPAMQMRSLAEELNCRISPHPFFTLPGLTHFNVCQDAMHILFCKGVLSHCMGNALKHWCWHSTAVAGGTPQAKLATIWQSIQHLYKEFGGAQAWNLEVIYVCGHREATPKPTIFQEQSCRMQRPGAHLPCFGLEIQQWQHL